MTDDRRVPDDPRADRELWDLVAAHPGAGGAPDFLPRLADPARRGGLESGGGRRPAPSRGPALSPRRAGARRLRLLVAAATVAATAAVIAFAVMPALRGTDTATAADMLASMNAAGGAQTVHLRLVETERLSASSGEGASTVPASYDGRPHPQRHRRLPREGLALR